MTEKWEYFYEKLTFETKDFVVGFNKHLNARAVEGWKLVSVEYGHLQYYSYPELIWRR